MASAVTRKKNPMPLRCGSVSSACLKLGAKRPTKPATVNARHKARANAVQAGDGAGGEYGVVLGRIIHQRLGGALIEFLPVDYHLRPRMTAKLAKKFKKANGVNSGPARGDFGPSWSVADARAATSGAERQ